MLLISYKVFDWLRMKQIIPLFPIALTAGMSIKWWFECWF